MLDWLPWTVAGLWLVLAAVYAFYFRLLLLGSALVGASFAAATLLGIGALLLPAPFEAVSALLLERSGLPEYTRAIDARIAAIEELPADVWARLSAPFPFASGGGDEEGVAPAGPVPGPLERGLVPPLGRLLTLLLRAFTLFACMGVSAFALALRSATAAIGELQALRARVAELEAAPG